MKTCTKCDQTKDVEQFYKHSTTKDGRHTQCKACLKKPRKQWMGTPEQKEKARARNKVWRSNPVNVERDAANQRRRNHGPTGRAKHLHTGARGRAKVQGVQFKLTVERVQELLRQGVCALTGLELSFNKHDVYRNNPRCASLDRIDNTKGYTDDNVQVICWQANLAKGEYDLSFLFEAAQGIVRTISSQASKEEGSTTRELTSRSAKRHEAPRASLN
jgi:hypothetical protein